MAIETISLGGKSINLSATGFIATSPARLLGFYVNSTNAGTLVLKNGGGSGTALTGTITPAVGWHFLPVAGSVDLHATIAGTALDVTFVFNN